VAGDHALGDQGADAGEREAGSWKLVAGSKWLNCLLSRRGCWKLA